MSKIDLYFSRDEGLQKTSLSELLSKVASDPESAFTEGVKKRLEMMQAKGFWLYVLKVPLSNPPVLQPDQAVSLPQFLLEFGKCLEKIDFENRENAPASLLSELENMMEWSTRVVSAFEFRWAKKANVAEGDGN